MPVMPAFLALLTVNMRYQIHVLIFITGSLLDKAFSIRTVAPLCQSNQALLHVTFASLVSLRLPPAFITGRSPFHRIWIMSFWQWPGTNQSRSTYLVQQAGFTSPQSISDPLSMVTSAGCQSLLVGWIAVTRTSRICWTKWRLLSYFSFNHRAYMMHFLAQLLTSCIGTPVHKCGIAECDQSPFGDVDYFLAPLLPSTLFCMTSAQMIHKFRGITHVLVCPIVIIWITSYNMLAVKRRITISSRNTLRNLQNGFPLNAKVIIVAFIAEPLTRP